MQLEGEGGFIVRQSFKKRHMEIWWESNLWPSHNWLCTLPLNHQDRWNKNLTYIWEISIQLGIFLGKQLKLKGESTKKILTTFAFRYVAYFLYATHPLDPPYPPWLKFWPFVRLQGIADWLFLNFTQDYRILSILHRDFRLIHVLLIFS